MNTGLVLHPSARGLHRSHTHTHTHTHTPPFPFCLPLTAFHSVGCRLYLGKTLLLPLQSAFISAESWLCVGVREQQIAYTLTHTHTHTQTHTHMCASAGENMRTNRDHSLTTLGRLCPLVSALSAVGEWEWGKRLM